MAVHAAVTILDPALGIVRVDLAELDFGQNDTGQAVEQLFDAFSGERGDLDGDRDVGFGGPVGGFLAADLSAVRRTCGSHLRPGTEIASRTKRPAAQFERIRRLFTGRAGRRGRRVHGVIESARRIRHGIRLIPRQDGRKVWRGKGAGIHEEGRQGGEGGAGGEVVDEDGTGGAAVVGSGDGAKALGAGGVPELELDASALGAGAELDNA